MSDVIEAVKRQVRKNVPALIFSKRRQVAGLIGDRNPDAPYDAEMAAELRLQIIADLAVRLDEAQKIIDRLDKTADQKPAVDGDVVYCPNGHACTTWHDGMPHCETCQHEGLEQYKAGTTYLVADCYSTSEAAALAAAKGE